MRRLRVLVAALVLPALLPACQPKAASTPEATPPPAADSSAARPTPPPPGPALRGTRWLLARLEGEAVAPNAQRPLSLQLLTAQPRAEGDAGCNRFSGEYRQADPDRLRFGAMLSTRMACDRIGLETKYLDALARARRFALQADSLRLYDSLGTRPLAVFGLGR